MVLVREFEIETREFLVRDAVSSRTTPIRDPRWDFLRTIHLRMYKSTYLYIWRASEVTRQKSDVRTCFMRMHQLVRPYLF